MLTTKDITAEILANMTDWELYMFLGSFSECEEMAVRPMSEALTLNLLLEIGRRAMHPGMPKNLGAPR